jgi:hypothetical protein
LLPSKFAKVVNVCACALIAAIALTKVRAPARCHVNLSCSIA